MSTKKTSAKSYTKAAISGFSWQTTLKIILMGISVIKISILARLLTPSDFGLFALVSIALGLSEAITQTGINVTIIQSKEKVASFIDTAWVIAIVRGFLIGIIMLMLGLGMQWYFAEPQLLPLVAIAALVPVIKGFINPYVVILHKKMLFFKDTIYHFSRIIVESLLAILIGWLTGSVWALVFALIGGAIFEVIISFAFFSKRPRFHYLPSKGKTILQNAKWLSLTTMLGYLNENVDDFILGKILGTYSLGIYHNAYALSHKTTYDFSKSAGHSTLPIFARIAHKSQRLKRAFKKSLWALIGVMLLISLPLILAPGFIVNVFLGDQWIQAIPLIRPLVFAGIIQGITNLSNVLFIAKKQYKIINFHLLSSLLVMIVLLVWWGNTAHLIGAAWGILVSRLITLPIIIWGISNVNRHNS